MKKNENILYYMRKSAEKRGPLPKGTKCFSAKLAKFVYIISFAYTLGINLLYLISVKMQSNLFVSRIGKENLTTLQKDQLAAVNNSIIFVLILTALLIAGFVLLFTRIYNLSLLLTAPSCIALCLHFAERMSDTLEANGLACSFTYNHLVPLSLLFLCAAVYCIIGIVYDVRENKMYKKFTSKLYTQYSGQYENLTDEQWSEFLENYNK